MAVGLNGRKRVAHTVDDDDENIMTEECLFSVKDADVSGVIMVALWGEDLTDKATMDAQQASAKNVTIKKIYATGTTIADSDFFLLK
jgi:hypothetical protein